MSSLKNELTLHRSAGYRAAMARSKINVKVAERPEASGGENDGSVSDSQSWGIISFDSLSDAVNDIKEPPAVTHPVFRKPSRRSIDKS